MDVEATLGAMTTPGLVVGNGSIENFSISLSGEFAVWGLKIQPYGLTFAYDVANSQFQMYGALYVDVSGNIIQAAMGDQSDPGLIVDSNGTENVNMGLSGQFLVDGLGIDIPNGNPLTLVYTKATSDYLISGTISVPEIR
jgi:hypothetical protein